MGKASARVIVAIVSIVLDQWFVRSARVVGKEHLEGDVRASLVRLTSKYDAVLRRLTP